MNSASAAASAAFNDEMARILNYGALNLAMGIGYRMGLFEAMDDCQTLQSPAMIAEKAGLAERYVTEWLGVMVCGGIVRHEVGPENEDLFQLPKAHADWLTRRAGASNLGVYTQEIPLLTSCALEAVCAGFTTGEGVGYEQYPNFQRFMSQLADAKHRQVLVDLFLPSVERGKLAKDLKKGIRVCDVGCGTGLAVILMAEAFPRSRFVGLDIAREAIRQAAETAERQRLENVSFVEADAAILSGKPEFNNRFDYVTAFDAIHDQPRPLEALKNIHGMLRPGGRFSMIDIAAGSRLAENRSHPMGMFLYTVSLMHCMPVGLAGGGAGLGMMWGRATAVNMLQAAGFAAVAVESIPQDDFNLHYFCRKAATGPEAEG